MDKQMPDGGLTRRSLMRAPAVTLGAITAGRMVFGSSAPAAAALPSVLDLAGGNARLFKNKAFHQKRKRMQSFAFDSINRKLFVATPLDVHKKLGDLEIAQIRLYAGKVGELSGHRMIVRNAGHGVAFGVEPIGKDSYIWVEDESSPTGYGTGLARWKFVSGRDTGTDLSPASAPYLGDRSMHAGSEQVTCSVDHVYDYGDGKPRLAVRRRDPGESIRYEIYRLGGLDHPPELEWAARQDDFKLAGRVEREVWQGWALYGNRIYSLTGSYKKNDIRLWLDTPTAPLSTKWADVGPMTRTRIVKQAVPAGVSGWEPEGLAIYRPSSPANAVRLNWGLTAGGDPRRSSIYYKTTT